MLSYHRGFDSNRSLYQYFSTLLYELITISITLRYPYVFLIYLDSFPCLLDFFAQVILSCRQFDIYFLKL